LNPYQTGDAEGDQAMKNKYPNPSDAVAAILKAGTVSFDANHPAHQNCASQESKP
jgi:hypothetical protein